MTSYNFEANAIFVIFLALREYDTVGIANWFFHEIRDLEHTVQ
jgi:hypothetical protein